jgi:hypothetical protein
MSMRHHRPVLGNGSILRQDSVRFRLLVGLISLLLVLLAEGPHRAAAGGFTDESIRGTWGFSASGTIVPPAVPAATPAVAAGIMRFDGTGGCSIADTINIGGASAFRTSTICSYSVTPNGMGSIQALFPGDPGPTPLSFVIVDEKSEIRFIRTDLGVASGVVRRQ